MFVAQAQSQIDFLRYNDNFSYLKSDTIKKKGTEKLKHLPIGTIGNTSLGGEVREQLQYYKYFNFGEPPSPSNQSNTWQLWHRAMAHANIELGSKMRIFTQVGSTFRFLNTNAPIPEIDENHLSLHQLFGEYKFSRNWTARIGRQEMSYGSHRLITFREGPNTRLAFDAAVIKYNSEKRKLDLIALSPVVSRKGVFDDGTFKDFIIGIYATEILLPKKLVLDYYFLNFESNRRKYNYKAGTDSRRVAGFRAFSQNRVANYEAEATYQFGTFNDLRVNAYSLSVDMNVSLLPKSGLIFGIAGNYVSGDKDNSDTHLNTYNPLFSKPQYGLTAPIGASNVITFNPYLRISPTRKMSILAGVYFMQRQSDQDGTYTPDGTELRPRPEKLFIATEKEIGTLLVLESIYSVNNHLSFAFDASEFFAGKFLKQTGKGKDISYLALKASYKF
jgi:hypothetical protein